ncbi:hypothetical protein BDY24DRAFT_358213 [Mrakia frigida]|uniref:uncharacterized protein n=1 Tax=Mrakia frigida TaxID=29902 RepID=UPI003FCBFC05
MKFGKQIQSLQIPGWGPYYMNYKFLKKIINSLVANRPASELAALVADIRPAPPFPTPSSSASLTSSSTTSTYLSNASPLGETSLPPPLSQTEPLPPLELDEEEDGPLPPGTTPPTPGFGATSRGGDGGGARQDGFFSDMAGVGTGRSDEGETLRAHRTVFFFKLEREIEKINAFYLQKERDLRLRLLTLLSNRKRLIRSSRPGGDQRSGLLSGGGGGGGGSGGSGLEGGRRAEWKALEEGWRVFEKDLSKLQQFIEINAIGFRKILKKWDKRSKSNTKELYLERQVEVQPCFNREFIAKLSDIVAANLLDLENENEGLHDEIDFEFPDSLDRRLEFDIVTVNSPLNGLSDLESDLTNSIATGDRDIILPAFGRALEDARRFEENKVDAERILWKGALEVSEDLVDDVVGVIGDGLSWDSVGGINARTLLHDAAISGSISFARHCVARGLDVGRRDAYDRTPLHYSTIFGHSSLVSYLLSVNSDPSAVDMDGYTPLIHSIVNGQIDCVKILLDGSGASSASIIEPTAVSNDLIPLSLACQNGHEEVARLLLRKGAKVIPNSEGLYPQHLAAREGHAEICKLLVEEGGPAAGGKDRADKYNQWTPLFHAATGDASSHVLCVKVLVEAGCDVNVTDEYGKTPLFYAAYYGHVGSIEILLKAGAIVTVNKLGMSAKGKQPLLGTPTTATKATSLSPSSDAGLDDLDLDDPMNGDGDLIPSLSLPPPIVPLQVYGHNYLDKRCLVQLSLGHPFSRSSSLNGYPIPAVKLYGSSDSNHHLQSWSSLKLVMTSKPDVTSIPHSVILPLADEREVFSFQVAAENLPSFSLDFSLYPTFGSKLIGKAVVLPSAFDQIKSHQSFVAPLLDHNLKTIGEVAFELSVVRPFIGVQLEIGGRVETYWKSTTVPTFSGLSQDHGRQFQPHRPLSVATSSPLLTGSIAPPPPPLSHGANTENGLVTSTSLSGEYVNIIVQVTKDLVPMVFSEWALPIGGFQLGVCDVTAKQFEALATSQEKTLEDQRGMLDEHSSASDWFRTIEGSMSSLETVLSTLPLKLGVNIGLRYTSKNDTLRLGFNNVLEINSFVDSVLQVIYEAGKATTTTSSHLQPSSTPTASSGRNRKIVFSCFDPNVSSFINFKQPNYAVFFASYCGLSRYRGGEGVLVEAGVDEEDDKRCMSVREAVKFAKANNLLGVMLDATLIAQVPHLIYSVKESGLILATFGRESDVSLLLSGHGIEGVPTVDASMKDGVIVYSF